MQLPFPLAEVPDDFAREKGRKLFAGGGAEFVKGVVAMSGLPDGDRLEVCFAGRSNVGKSSLINALTNRKGLARASNTPGRTQEINFFTLEETHYLVDLPGYGYANAPLPIVERVWIAGYRYALLLISLASLVIAWRVRSTTLGRIVIVLLVHAATKGLAMSMFNETRLLMTAFLSLEIAVVCSFTALVLSQHPNERPPIPTP